MTEKDSACLAKIEVIVKDMHTRLFGNGQPGELDKLRDRILPLESHRHQFIGAVGVVSFILLLLGGTFIAHILGGGK